jgi:predicted phosphodiesterase
MKKLDLSEISKGLAEGPIGQAKIKRLEKAREELTEALLQMLKHVRPYEIPVSTKENTIKFGVIGDTHIGSLYQRIDCLSLFYEYCYDNDIDTVLHVGDVLAGWKVYKGQEFELHPNGRSWKEQRDMFSSGVPEYPGLKTIFITGNHDSSFKKQIGMIPGEELARVRDDWKFIGEHTGTVIMKTEKGQKFIVQLLHPSGGTAYAVSYHPQKIIESLSGGQKPDLICVGHYHKSLYMPAYRNVSCIEVGCFESQTPFMVQKSIAAHIGGWIITVTLNDRAKLTSKMKAEWIGFFEEAK